MNLFRKKPVVIEAVRLPVSKDDMLGWGSVCGFLMMRCPNFQIVDHGADNCALEIGTLEGVMRADPGDWVIRGVKGEFYPCKPDIFAATYEPA